MDLAEYQTLALATAPIAVTESHLEGINCACLGLGGECGEILDHFKKWRYQGHEIDFDKLREELGDILWYAALMAHSLNTDLETVAEENIKKLQKRYPEGFTPERSKNRVICHPTAGIHPRRRRIC